MAASSLRVMRLHHIPVVSDFSTRREQGGTTAQHLPNSVLRFSAILRYKMMIKDIFKKVSRGIIFLKASRRIFYDFPCKIKELHWISCLRRGTCEQHFQAGTRSGAMETLVYKNKEFPKGGTKVERIDR